MPSKTAVYRHINLRPEDDDRLEQLVEASGLNRNQFIKMLIRALTENDVAALQRRLES
jgi:hypothetical protein